MPDNRQSSKQRRAARNRAAREALAARRENAMATRSRSDEVATFSAAGGGSDLAGAGAGPTGRGVLAGRYRSRRVGDTAVLVALVLAIVSAVSMLFVRVPVDDRGEPLPTQFRGVYIQARETLTGRDIGDQTTSLIDAQGPSVLLILVLPVLVCVFAVWANRRPDRSRMLTFAMLALAGTVILGAGFLFLPSLIALAVASFQIRKAEVPARAAAQAGAGGGAAASGTGRAGARGTGGRDVIDLDSEEVTSDPGDDDDRGSPPGR